MVFLVEGILTSEGCFGGVTNGISLYTDSWHTVEMWQLQSVLNMKSLEDCTQGVVFETSAEICQDWRLTQWFPEDLEESQLVYESKKPQIILKGICCQQKVLFLN